MRKPTDPPFLDSISLRRDLVPGFEAYPFSIPAVKNLYSLKLHPRVTFLIGENGTGKSTLLEGIAVAEGFNAEGGSRNFMFETRETKYPLARYLQLGRGAVRLARSDSFFLRAESFYNVATAIEKLGFAPNQSPYGPVSFHEQSHGESFLNLLLNRLGSNGLYLMDEPEAALSPQRQLSFLVALHNLVQRGSQLIIATHSPIIMAYPDATIYSFTEGGIAPIAYQETEHYKVTKAFLSRTEKMLADLLSDAEDGAVS
jgi:predicted ATPase